MPDRPKTPLRIVYILDTRHALLPKEVERNGPTREAIKGCFSGQGVRTSAKRSGPSGKGQFKEQAVIVELRSGGDNGLGSLPVTLAEIRLAGKTIERQLSTGDLDIGVQSVILDTE